MPEAAPVGHCVQTDWDPEAVKEPTGQAVQPVASASVLNCPGLQARHVFAATYLPGEQERVVVVVVVVEEVPVHRHPRQLHPNSLSRNGHTNRESKSQ
jgi:hypothetical protein